MTATSKVEASTSSLASSDEVAKSDYPALYQVSDQGSLDRQASYKRWSLAELVLAIGGALAGMLLAGGAHQQGAAVTAALAFGGALLIRIVIRTRHDDGAWFEGRAVAESVKTESWRYMMRVPPFDDDATSDLVFVDQLEAILVAARAVTEFPMSTQDAPQITGRMRAVRALDLGARAHLYREARIGDQRDWYFQNAIRHARASRLFSRWSVVAEAAAILVAVVAVFDARVAAVSPLGVLAALAVSFGAWNQLSRHAEVARAYRLAHQDLLGIIDLSATIGSEQALDRIVRAGEGAISREHTVWVAKRTELSRSATPASKDGFSAQ